MCIYIYIYIYIYVYMYMYMHVYMYMYTAAMFLVFLSNTYGSGSHVSNID